MPKYTSNIQLLEAINGHLRNSGQPEINLDDFNIFYNGEVDKTQNVQRSEQQNRTVSDIYSKLTNLLINNNAANKDLKNELPEIIHAGKRAYLADLREKAQRTASAHAKKSEANQINAEKKAAKLELERVRKERAKAQLRASGMKNVTDKDVELTTVKGDISSARGRHLLTALLNRVGLGPKDERRAQVAYPVKSDTEIFEPVQCGGIDDGVILKGGKYTPKNVPSNGKTVLVFTGSREPGAKQIKSIKDAYLQQGYTVYQFDYRGFGTSHQIDKNGNVVSSSMSEKTMYKDGMVMYNHLVKQLGIKPKDIVLHGYSLGAAVASRVALEATKEMQQNGKVFVPEKHGIGGVVLHSPIRTMFKASRAIATWFGGMFAKHYVGNYDTVQHMKDLSTIDPTIPVHLVSGDPNPNSYDFDHLSHQFTGVDKALEGKFNNLTTFVGESDHDGLKGQDLVPNVQANDPNLAALAHGRAPAAPQVQHVQQQNGMQL